MPGTASAETTAGETHRSETAALPVRPGVVIGILVVSAFVMILNETILSVALRDLTRDLDVSTTTVQWLTSGFLLTMAVVIPTTGFLLERFTPRQVFLASISLFTAGTLISALAPGFGVLLVGRVVQACGTAVMIPLLMTSVMRLVPPQRRGSAMGTITIVIAVAPAIGPTIGGAVLAYLGWRWMFWVVLPLAVLVLIVGLVIMRLAGETRRVPLDVLSVLLSAVGFGGLLYGLATLGEPGGGHGVPPWVPIAVGAVAVVLFVWRQLLLQRHDRALLDLRPLTHRTYVVALVLVALMFMCLLGAAAILLPLYLQTVLNQDTFVTGLAVLPGGLVLGLLGRPVGALFDRVGARPLVIPGSLALAVSLWLFASLGAGSPLWAVVAIHILLMAGLGLMMSPLMTAALGVLPVHLYSHGSAILTTLQQVMGAFGTAVFVSVAALGSASPSGNPDGAGLRLSFVVAACIGVAAFVVSLFIGGKPPATTEDGSTPNAPGMDGGIDAGPEVGFGAVVPTDDAVPADGELAAADGTERADGELAATGAAHADADAPAAAAPVLSGRIGTVDGEAIVTLVDADGRQRGRTRTSGGHYELALPGAGSWQLVVSAPGHVPHAERVQAPDVAGLAHDVTLRPSVPRDGGVTSVDDVLDVRATGEPAAPR